MLFISSYNVSVPNDSRIISVPCGSSFGMLGKNQNKHSGDLPPTVSDLPSSQLFMTPTMTGVQCTVIFVNKD